MNSATRIIAPLLLLALSAHVYAAGPIKTLKVGNWSGGSYTNDQTGKFNHCAVSASYKDGTTFFISVGNTYGWQLGFARQNWQLQVGQNIPVDITFDGHGPYHVFAAVALPTFVVVGMPATSELVRRFRNATQMSALANGQLFNFVLTDTSKVLPALVQCVRENTGGVAPSVVHAPHVVTPPPAQMDTVTSNPPNADLHDEALELATNFILGAKLDNPKVLSKSETPVQYASFGVDWTANNAMGAVRILPGQPGTDGIDVAAAVVAADAKECKGKFASARSSDMVDSEVVFRGFSSCEDSAGSRSVQYFIVPRKKGGFVLFSVAGAPSAGDSSAALTPERTSAFQKAALTAAN